MSMGIRANNVLAFECDEPLYHTKEFNRVSYLNALILPWSALRSSAGMGFGLLDKNSLLGNGCIEKSMITILTMANRNIWKPVCCGNNNNSAITGIIDCQSLN